MQQDEGARTKPRRRRLAVHPISSQAEREIFARNLRRFRHEADLSQRELAGYTGVAQAHISQVENARHNIEINTMVKLADFLGKPLYLLLMPGGGAPAKIERGRIGGGAAGAGVR